MPFNPRPRFDWQLRTRTLALGPHTRIMGILNVTPDSFSDGGHFYTPANETERALTHALAMLDAGADILDIGGESTRPNATPITPGEEQARILPVLAAILHERPATILSVDTYNASTAQHAIAAGAEIVNDVSGHLWDPAMSATCALLACATILMHTRGTPQTWHNLPPIETPAILPLILSGLQQRIAAATAAGIAPNRIVVDPGFGFGILGDQNYTLHAHLDTLATLHLPLLTGTSRKGFLTKTLQRRGLQPLPASAPTHLAASTQTPATTARLHATTASNVAAILAGAHLLRVHDILPAVEAATIADAILNAL